MPDVIEHAAHDSLNEQRSETLKLASVSTYDSDQNGPLEQFATTAVVRLGPGERAPRGYATAAIPKNGFLLGVFTDDAGRAHFARIEAAGAKRIAYLEAAS